MTSEVSDGPGLALQYRHLLLVVEMRLFHVFAETRIQNIHLLHLPALEVRQEAHAHSRSALVYGEAVEPADQLLLGVLGPGAPGHLVHVVVDVDKAGRLAEVRDDQSGVGGGAEIFATTDDQVVPFLHVVVGDVKLASGVVWADVPVLELRPSTRFQLSRIDMLVIQWVHGMEDGISRGGLLVDLFDKFRPVPNGTGEVPSVDEVELGAEVPRLLNVVDLELYVGRNPDNCQLAVFKIVDRTYQ